MRTLKEMRLAYSKAGYSDSEFEELLYSARSTKKLVQFADKLIDSWYKAAEKYFDKLDRESCHWKREGFDSREDYRDRLINLYPYNGCVLDYLDADLAEIDSRIGFICGQIMGYEYSLAF